MDWKKILERDERRRQESESKKAQAEQIETQKWYESLHREEAGKSSNE